MFALNAVQPMEKYSDQWRNNEPSSSIHRIGIFKKAMLQSVSVNQIANKVVKHPYVMCLRV